MNGTEWDLCFWERRIWWAWLSQNAFYRLRICIEKQIREKAAVNKVEIRFKINIKIYRGFQ